MEGKEIKTVTLQTRIKRVENGFGIKYYLETKTWDNYIPELDSFLEGLAFIVFQPLYILLYLFNNLAYRWKIHSEYTSLETAFIVSEKLKAEYTLEKQEAEKEKAKHKVKRKVTIYE